MKQINTLLKGLAIATILFYFSTLNALAQETGNISGNISDSVETVIGAVVVVEGNNTLGAFTDTDGNFVIKNIKPGSYNILVTYFGYKPLKIENVQVEAGKTTAMGNVYMKIDAEEGEEVVVIGTRTTNTEESAVKETKESKQVVNVISAEQISKSQDRDAAQVMQRVPGVTLIQNRFILVRGLSERYNTVLLNGVVAPSSESETRAFSFDIVPSNMIDRLLIYKSGAPELPGDFAGAVVRLYTRSTVSENISQLSVTGGYRHGTTFGKALREKDNGLAEAFSFGDGRRQLPDEVPDYDLKKIAANDINSINEISRSFENNWATKSVTALPDLRLNYMLGRKFELGKFKIGTINNLSYSNTSQLANQERNLYSGYDTVSNESLTTYNFKDKIHSNDVRIGALSNWSMQASPRFRLEFRNLYTRLGSSELMFREGTNYNSRNNIRQYSMRYTANSLYSGQLQGTHTSASDKTKFIWLMGYSSISKKDPDWKRVTMLKSLDNPDDPYTVYVANTATATDGARFYMDMKESSVAGGTEISHKFAKDADSSGITVNAGVYVDYKQRTYSARFLSYVAQSPLTADVKNAPYDQIYDPANISYPNKIFISEGSAPTDRYYATNSLMAGYAGVTIPFLKKFNLTGGLRVEHNVQVLRVDKESADLVNNPKTSPLPFANLSYNITKKMLIRFAYGKTINRPEFRELSPFNYYDFTIPANKVGNPDLKNCNIDNLDLRWEFYPKAGEMISLGVFYKSFMNPIEIYQVPTGSYTPVFQYGNAKSATSQGVELEIRKSLLDLTASKFINNFSLLLNASMIKSEIKFDKLANSLQLTKRPMQGQSPYIVNAGIYYNDDDRKWQISILYNVFGPRIAIVGDKQSRSWYEMPRHLVDLTISKDLTKRLSMKIGISDLLNSKYRIKEDANYNSKLTDANVDKVIQSYNTGQYFNLGFNYKF